VFVQSPVHQDVSEHLGVFGLDKRVSVTDEVSSGNVVVDCLWQQDGWVKAVAHTACVHYDSGTGQHKLVNKGMSGQYSVVI